MYLEIRDWERNATWIVNTPLYIYVMAIDGMIAVELFQEGNVDVAD